MPRKSAAPKKTGREKYACRNCDFTTDDRAKAIRHRDDESHQVRVRQENGYQVLGEGANDKE
jgi:hypothetical protein